MSSADSSDNESGSSDGEDDDDNESYSNDEFVFNNCLQQLVQDVSINECSKVTKLGIWFGSYDYSNGDNVNWEKDGDFIVQNTQLKILKINARQSCGSYYQSIHEGYEGFCCKLAHNRSIIRLCLDGFISNSARDYTFKVLLNTITIFGMLRLWIDMVDVLNI